MLLLMITNQSIIESIEKHCQATGMAETTFGKKVVNDGKLLSRLRGGKSISIDTYNRILAETVTVSTEAAE
jgi:hypothetical protein